MWVLFRPGGLLVFSITSPSLNPKWVQSNGGLLPTCAGCLLLGWLWAAGMRVMWAQVPPGVSRDSLENILPKVGHGGQEVEGGIC